MGVVQLLATGGGGGGGGDGGAGAVCPPEPPPPHAVARKKGTNTNKKNREWLAIIKNRLTPVSAWLNESNILPILAGNLLGPTKNIG